MTSKRARGLRSVLPLTTRYEMQDGRCAAACGGQHRLEAAALPPSGSMPSSRVALPLSVHTESAAHGMLDICHQLGTELCSATSRGDNGLFSFHASVAGVHGSSSMVHTHPRHAWFPEPRHATCDCAALRCSIHRAVSCTGGPSCIAAQHIRGVPLALLLS